MWLSLLLARRTMSRQNTWSWPQPVYACLFVLYAPPVNSSRLLYGGRNAYFNVPLDTRSWNPACFRITILASWTWDARRYLPRGLPFGFTAMNYHISTFGRLIMALILAVRAQADYMEMDDRNNSISYSVNWTRNFSGYQNPLNDAQLFDGTA